MDGAAEEEQQPLVHEGADLDAAPAAAPPLEAAPAALAPPAAAAAGLLLLLLALLLLLLRARRARPRGRTVLLVGPSDAGKTTIFLRLRDGPGHAATVASMAENEGEFVPHAERAAAAAGGRRPRPVRVVDVPGHPRLRRARFDAHAASAAAIVFVVDAVDFMPRRAEAAEQLYDVLAHPAVARRRVPVLLACNKADAGPRAHTVDFVRRRLEKEVDVMRATRGALDDSGGGAAAAADAGEPLGMPGEPFTFDAHARAAGVRVAAAATSATDAGGLAEVEAFIRRCVPA